MNTILFRFSLNISDLLPRSNRADKRSRPCYFLALHNPTVLPSGSCIHANVPVGISTGGTSIFRRAILLFPDMPPRHPRPRRKLCSDAARAPARSGARPPRLDFPVEEFFMEFLRLGAVPAPNFKMHHRSSHAVLLGSKRLASQAFRKGPQIYHSSGRSAKLISAESVLPSRALTFRVSHCWGCGIQALNSPGGRRPCLYDR